MTVYENISSKFVSELLENLILEYYFVTVIRVQTIRHNKHPSPEHRLHLWGEGGNSPLPPINGAYVPEEAEHIHVTKTMLIKKNHTNALVLQIYVYKLENWKYVDNSYMNPNPPNSSRFLVRLQNDPNTVALECHQRRFNIKP